VRAKIGKTLEIADWRAVATRFYDRTEHEQRKSVTRLWLPEAKSADEASRTFDKRIATMTQEELVCLFVDLTVIGEVRVAQYCHPDLEHLPGLAKRYGVNAEKVKRDVEAQIKQSTKKPKPAADKKPQAAKPEKKKNAKKK
jgi:hypothetical protein